MIRLGRAAAGLLFLGVILVALRAAATGELATPPLDSLDAFEAWVDIRGPIPTAIALVRFVSEIVAWYALALSTIQLVARAFRLRHVVVVADALSLPGMRRLVHATLGLGLGVAAAGATATHEPAVAPDVPAMERLADPAPGTARQRPIDVGTAVMRPVDEPSTATARMEPWSGPATSPTSWRVEPGDSFWSIATEILETSWQRPPSEDEIDPFWRALVLANRGRLVVEDDPDLVLPGQVFDVPPVPGRK